MSDTTTGSRHRRTHAPQRALPLLEQADGGEAGALHRDAQELHRALSELIRVYQFRDRDRICCYDVSVAQCNALEVLVRHGPVTLNELAAGLYLDKSTTSRIVDGLERKGYVVRRTHPEDRRALLLEPTMSGRQLMARIEHDILEEEKHLLAEFEPEVRQAMARLIARLARAAAARVDTSGGTCCRID
jgi:MarR family transcriptional regulator, 2-MHQ and catechol-resistance regulon repressor